MTQSFDYFVVFAEMRTGSNFLEANLNAFEGFQCLGEAFNPHFIGYPNASEILGVDQQTRDADPFALIRAVKSTPDHLSGFRFFNDHDPRILDAMLQDPRCAKIILTRNPLDSYVSLRIAEATGQWKLTDVRKRKDSKVMFDGARFARHVERLQEFQVKVLNALQKSGQTAFYVAYEDLQDVDVMNGLARFLGRAERLEALDGKLKRQNPSPVTDKVENPNDISAALAALDRFNLSRTPNFEPRRGGAVPSYLATRQAGLLFMPVPGGPTEAVQQWMMQADGQADRLLGDFNQRQLRDWKSKHSPHRSFTVLRHPVLRAHEVFCTRILTDGQGSFRKIRRTLRNRFGLPIPETMVAASYTREDHRRAFSAFLDWLQANLNGQTAIRQDGHWVAQASILSGFGQVQLPDLVLREDELAEVLPGLAQKLGGQPVPYGATDAPIPFSLAEIYDADIEKRAQLAYARDYEAFGFRAWRS